MRLWVKNQHSISKTHFKWIRNFLTDKISESHQWRICVCFRVVIEDNPRPETAYYFPRRAGSNCKISFTKMWRIGGLVNKDEDRLDIQRSLKCLKSLNQPGFADRSVQQLLQNYEVKEQFCHSRSDRADTSWMLSSPCWVMAFINHWPAVMYLREKGVFYNFLKVTGVSQEE